MWAHNEGSQPEHKAIEHGEIRRTLSGAIADQELMFEQERFSCDLARAARAEEFREGHEQMDRQEEQIAHELKLSCRPIYARLHHSGDLCQSCQFATHTSQRGAGLHRYFNYIRVRSFLLSGAPPDPRCQL